MKIPVGSETQMRYAAMAAMDEFAVESMEFLRTERAKHDYQALYAALIAMALRALHTRKSWTRIVNAAFRASRSAQDQVRAALGIEKYEAGLHFASITGARKISLAIQTKAYETARKAAEMATTEATNQDLEELFDTASSSAVNSATIGFLMLFGELVMISSMAAGSKEYIWRSHTDDRVRPAHLALNGVRCKWEDPPLKADVSSNHENDHPGGDYFCRCTAIPI